MRKKRESRLTATQVIISLGLFGIILFYVAEFQVGSEPWKAIIRSLGATVFSVALVSFFYELLIAEKHFVEFREQLSTAVNESEGLYSSCHRLGIRAIYRSRDECEAEQPLRRRIDDAAENSRVLCVGRTLFHIFNRREELEIGLAKGLSFEFACIDPKRVDSLLRKTTFINKDDITSALAQLRHLVSWAEKEKPRGSIELRYHRAGMIDTVMTFSSTSGAEMLNWDLSFGRDPRDKRVMILDVAEKSLGADLKARYETIYEDAESQVRYSNGVCEYFKPQLHEQT